MRVALLQFLLAINFSNPFTTPGYMVQNNIANLVGNIAYVIIVVTTHMFVSGCAFE